MISLSVKNIFILIIEWYYSEQNFVTSVVTNQHMYMYDGVRSFMMSELINFALKITMTNSSVIVFCITLGDLE